MSDIQLHSSIVALVSLASGIASNHPSMGRCQIDRLRSQGVPEAHIQTVIEIARHIRDEASEKLDAAFDAFEEGVNEEQATAPAGEACCSSTPSGESCC
ncbi:MAG: hypothetical protein ACWA5X_04550 [bacterium]